MLKHVQKACTFVRLQEELFFLIGYIPTGNRFRPVENAVGQILLPTDPIFGSVEFQLVQELDQLKMADVQATILGVFIL